MEPEKRPEGQADNGRLLGETTGQLFTQLISQSSELVKKELELARAELRADMRQEMKSLGGIGTAGILGLAGFALLLTTCVLALAVAIPAWAAALIVTGVVLSGAAIAGFVGYSMRVKHPLDRTQRSLKE